MRISLEEIDKSRKGRPPIAEASGYVTAKLPAELHARFSKACESLQNSHAAVIRHLIAEFCNGMEKSRKAKKTKA